MSEVYEKYFDYGPSIGQEVNVKNTIVVAAGSGEDSFTGTITKANDNCIVVEKENGVEMTLVPEWGGLQVHAHGGRIGPVQEIEEL